MNPRAKKFVFLGVKRNMKGYRIWDPKNKKIVLSQHVKFLEISLLIAGGEEEDQGCIAAGGD